MDKQKIVGKRWMSALLALILTMTLLPAPSAAADDSPNGENAIQNPGFEKPSISQTFKYIPQQDVSAWETTAKEGMIEFGRNWGNQTAPHYTSTDKNNAEGAQFAELNADEESTLYQNVTTVGGNVYEWGLQHRGRIGVDKMALIIGPTQEYAPSKPSKDGRDQYMQLTDWVHDNQKKLEFTIRDNGCSQRLTVYSKPFGANGTFLGGSGSESPFSTEVSNIYTERWDVWIIATDNQRWVGYGIKDNTYQGDKGVGGGLSYECSYLVPDGQTQTTFAFCSYSSTPPAGLQVAKTYGNLIDDLQFSLYHTVTISATPGSSKIMASTKINENTQELDFSKNGGSIVVRNNNDLTLTVWENKNALNNGLETEFAGALVIGPNGSRFYPVGDPNMWKKVEEPDESGQKHYGFTLNVSDPVSIRLIFVQSPAVTYFANGGTYEAEDGNTSGVVSFKETVDDSGEQHKRDPYTSQAAKGPDGWRFDGWLPVRDKLLLPAKHTVSYNYDSANPAFTFKIDGENDKVVPHSGVTLVAQWSYLQCAQVQLRGEDGAFEKNDKAGTVTIISAAETNDAAVDSGSDECYAKTGATVTAKAKANNGYYFLGWAVEGSDEYVSTYPTYTYHVSGQETRTVYARFAKQYAVTYEWAEAPHWPLTGDKQPALPSPNIVLQGDSYVISTKYSAGDSIKDTVSGVPGHWVFNGWKDQTATDGDYLTGSIPNVNRKYVLVGYWTWVPNSEYQLSYSVGNNTTCWIPAGSISLPVNGTYYKDANVTVADALTTSRDKVMLSDTLQLEGTWKFTGWKRSDTDEIVPAKHSITMPGHNLELTAQWEFTPKTYTVKYDLAGGEGTAPEGHTTFDYSRYTNGKTGVVAKKGIPFGVGITLMDFTGTPPENTYFAGWSLKNTSGMTDDEKENVPTQGAGAVVNSTMMEVTDDNKEVTLYAVYRNTSKITVEFDVNAPNMGSVSVKSGVFTVAGNSVTGDPLTSVATAKPGYHFTGWTVEVVPENGDNASFEPLDNALLTVKSTNFGAEDAGKRFVFQAQFAPIDPVKPGGDDSKDSYYFAIEKIDAQDSHALNGATFALYQYSSDGKTVNRTTAKTARNGSESGIALFSVDNKNSYEGIWYYAEVTAPEGYVLDSTEHKITKNDFSTSQSAAIRNAETVRNYRSSTPNMLNDTDHFAYVIGYKDGLVKPYGLITRAETTTIFFRLLKDSVRDSSLLTSSTYTDVPDNYWANTAISTMTGLGIVQGRSTTTFDPQSPITRAQFAAICARFDTGTSSGTQIFSDISGHWAEKYIQRAAELGWIKGFEDGTFRPDTYITRAQAMTMINRVLNRIPEEESDLLTGMNVWPDCNPGDWFYLAVQEATNSHAFKHKAGNYETWIGMSQNPDWTRYEN